MVMQSLTCLLLLLLLSSSMPIWTIAGAQADDEAALLAFKDAAVRRGGDGDALASWNSSSTGGFCGWEGVTCQGRPQRVVALSLPSRGFTGVLSPAIGNLSSLITLNLSNNGFGGDIPSSLGRLRHFSVLDLSNNSFSGELPSNLSFCANLTVMMLAYNQLRGRVPPEFGNKLTRLWFLNMENNNLTGVIPASLANLSSLRVMIFGYNQLEGAIPPGLGGILGLRKLTLAFNSLSGEPPSSMYNLSSLETLQIQGNMLHGGFPADVGSRFPRVQILSLAMNQFAGTIPASLSNITALEWFDLSENRFSGYVPSTLGRLPALTGLNLQINRLQADDAMGWEFVTSLSNCSQLRELLLSHNVALTGQLPTSIVNLSTALQAILLDGTGISGSIPSAIGNLFNLNYLDAGNTHIFGAIPKSIGKLENLVELHFGNTELSGVIPSSIGNLSELTTLEAYNSNFEGPIPASIGKMKKLLEIDLSMNRLNGSIPREIFKLPLLSNHLNLSYNLLSGPLPSEVGSLRNINQLLLSGNQLSGKIPDSIGECTVLEVLWLDNNSFEGSIPISLENVKGLSELKLSMNKLSGTIPDSIGSVRSLQQLYLAHNNLSGPIPTTLQNLTSLSELDLSFNNLQGKVPKEGIFRILTNISVTGNTGLCGGIPQLHLAECHKNSVKRDRKDKLKSLIIAVSTTGALLFLAFFIAVLHLTYKKIIQRHKSSFPPPTIEEKYGRLSYHALLNGTDGFSEANLLGKGGFGAVYKCTFQDERTMAAVKVFNPEQSGSNRSFVAECEALRRVRHRCLIKIITCCSSINHQGQEFKALVFEFMPNGSLNDWLHPKSDQPTLSNTLSIEQRLDIVVDIMDAMDYLHNHCQPPIIHCDLKPSNILLAEDMSARVGDFGISRILPECASSSLQNSNSTIGIRGSIGYVAPEYGEGSSVSTLGDIYSIGILLLEMFTGRSPTDDMFGGSLDLHKFVEDALPERVWDIVDSTMWLHTGAYDNTTRSIIQNYLVSVIALGISCSKKQPKERIQTKDAATEMHAIRDSYIKFAKSLVVENGRAVQ